MGRLLTLCVQIIRKFGHSTLQWFTPCWLFMMLCTKISSLCTLYIVHFVVMTNQGRTQNQGSERGRSSFKIFKETMSLLIRITFEFELYLTFFLEYNGNPYYLGHYNPPPKTGLQMFAVLSAQSLRYYPQEVCGTTHKKFAVQPTQGFRFNLHKVCGAIHTRFAVLPTQSLWFNPQKVCGATNTRFAVQPAQSLWYCMSRK